MLRQNNCVKQELVADGLTLQADVGESFLVKYIVVGEVDAAGYMTIKVDNYAVGYYRILGHRGNHLGCITPDDVGVNLMKQLVERGLKFTIPVAEGQKLTLDAHAGDGYVIVVYDRYDAGDIRSDRPNGTTSKTFSFIQYLTESAVIEEIGNMALDKALTPAEFPDFPAGKSVPPKMRVKLHGIVGSPVSTFASSGNGFYTTFLKLIREREVLLDDDRLGLLFKGKTNYGPGGDYADAQTLIGTGAVADAASSNVKFDDPFWFTPPLDFIAGEELNVVLSWHKDGTHTMPAGLPDVGLILECIRD